ncbi:hypothetical protein V6N11_041128 [Hibiscus sabdariffa]|uniref:Uncharacterized protein n=1 Tax=Hibiscus sabdariffa TaxID=183260 RepID=A0ABR2RJI0_9ROSI
MHLNDISDQERSNSRLKLRIREHSFSGLLQFPKANDDDCLEKRINCKVKELATPNLIIKLLPTVNRPKSNSVSTRSRELDLDPSLALRTPLYNTFPFPFSYPLTLSKPKKEDQVLG